MLLMYAHKCNDTSSFFLLFKMSINPSKFILYRKKFTVLMFFEKDFFYFYSFYSLFLIAFLAKILFGAAISLFYILCLSTYKFKPVRNVKILLLNILSRFRSTAWNWLMFWYITTVQAQFFKTEPIDNHKHQCQQRDSNTAPPTCLCDLSQSVILTLLKSRNN